jgi:hypothetical protein
MANSNKKSISMAIEFKKKEKLAKSEFDNDKNLQKNVYFA